MAGDAVVGALRIVLGLDTGSFEDGAKKASSQISDFGKRVAEIFSGVTLASLVEKTFSKIIDTFKEAGVKAFEFADKMGNMAQKVGISVEELTGLKLAADVSSVSMESLSAGLGRLSKSMVDATNNVGDAKLEFQALGINVRDASGALKSPLAVLTGIATKFEDTRDGAAKTAAALALLGKGGKDLIPLLNEGAGSLKEFTQIAKNMGLEISTNTAAQASVLNKNIIILQSSLQGVANQVFANVAPALVRMTNELVNTVKGGEAIRETANTITDSIKTILTNVIIVIEADQKIGAAFHELEQGVSASVLGIVDTLNRAIEPIVAWSKLVIDVMARRLSEIPGDVSDVIKAFQGLKDVLGSPQFDRANSHFEAMKANIGELPKISAPAAEIVKNLFKTLEEHSKHAADSLDEPNKKMEQLRLQIISLNVQTNDAKGAFNNYATGLAQAALSLKLTNDQTGSLIDKNGQLLPGIEKLNVAMLNLEAAKLTNDFLSPWDTYILKLQQIAKLQATDLPLSADIAAAANLKAAAVMAQGWGDAAAAIVSPVANAFKSLADINKKYAAIAKAAAIADATVNTFVAANKAYAAFAFAPPLAIAAAAAAIAAGLANVAKIVATPLPFAQGGQFKVGGVGGIDSQLVQFRATPGEMVDVRKPGATTTTNEITVNMRGRDLISKDMIRDLFNAINGGTRDGYRLKLAEA